MKYVCIDVLSKPRDESQRVAVEEGGSDPNLKHCSYRSTYQWQVHHNMRPMSRLDS